jgi:hypothetical protein
MDITVEPDIYCPIIDNNGNYQDNCPAFIKYGIKCPCGARDNWIYDSKQKFKQHIVCGKHRKWIQQLNNSKMNFYQENIKLQETVKMQQEIIGRNDMKITNLIAINRYLESKTIVPIHNQSVDLLEIDI